MIQGKNMEIHKDIALLISQPNGERLMKRLMPLKVFAVFRPRSKPVPRVNQVYSFVKGGLQVVYLSVYFDISPSPKSHTSHYFYCHDPSLKVRNLLEDCIAFEKGNG